MNKQEFIKQLQEKVDMWWDEYERLIKDDPDSNAAQRAYGMSRGYLGAIQIATQQGE